MAVRSRLPQIAAGIPVRVRQALQVGAEGIADAARDRVPVASGTLRNAIHVDVQHEGVYVVAGDTEAFYGHLVEFGTTHTAPRPFLIPAVEERRDDVRRIVAAALRDL